MLNNPNPQGFADLQALADPVRRRLYEYVLGRANPVSRDDAAAAVEIGRPLAAHHLDRLVAAGLLATEFHRRSGRTGPGAGRPAKFYRPSGRAVHASLPERRYEFAAELLAGAMEEGGDPSAAVAEAAWRRGQELGLEARRRLAGAGGDLRDALQSVLRDSGYAPFERDGELRMLNCPFHELAQRHRSLTCGMNLAMLQGLMAGAGLPPENARLDVQPGMCCVAIRGA
jgi:predicted ArsR family transcriptional regulator